MTGPSPLRSWAFWTLLGVALLCALGPWLGGLDGEAIDLGARLLPPGPGHPLGTDENGRDELARLLAGGRVSLAVGFGSGLLAAMLGAGIGLAAGWWSGPLGAALMRLTDFALAFPTIFVLLVAAALVGSDPPQLVLLIALTLWMSTARLVRGRALELREAQFVEAATALGAVPARILRVHVLPNLRDTLVVAAVLAVNHAILSESTVSFLGLGIRPPMASWGTMLTNAQAYLATSPWLAVAPGLAIAITVFAAHTLGDTLVHVPRRGRQAPREPEPTPRAEATRGRDGKTTTLRSRPR